MNYADMTEAQRLEWGRSERDARKADLTARTREGLIAAQGNAEVRRKAIQATRAQATAMVIEATRESRCAKGQQ